MEELKNIHNIHKNLFLYLFLEILLGIHLKLSNITNYIKNILVNKYGKFLQRCNFNNYFRTQDKYLIDLKYQNIYNNFMGNFQYKNSKK
jgi:hypothetical protein